MLRKKKWILPLYYGVYDFLLLFDAFPKVDSRRFQAFVAQQVSKKGYVTAFFQEVFRKEVPERMWMKGLMVDVIYRRKMLKLR